MAWSALLPIKQEIEACCKEFDTALLKILQRLLPPEGYDAGEDEGSSGDEHLASAVDEKELPPLFRCPGTDGDVVNVADESDDSSISIEDDTESSEADDEGDVDSESSEDTGGGGGGGGGGDAAIDCNTSICSADQAAATLLTLAESRPPPSSSSKKSSKHRAGKGTTQKAATRRRPMFSQTDTTYRIDDTKDLMYDLENVPKDIRKELPPQCGVTTDGAKFSFFPTFRRRTKSSPLTLHTCETIKIKSVLNGKEKVFVGEFVFLGVIVMTAMDPLFLL